MSENPWERSSVCVTLKGGKGYEDPWVVIKAQTVEEAKALTAEASGLSGEGITLVDLVHNASEHIHRINKIGGQLGGTVLPNSASSAPSTPAPAPAAEPAAQAEESAEDPLLKAVENAQSKSELIDLYIDHKAKFAPGSALEAALQKRTAEFA